MKPFRLGHNIILKDQRGVALLVVLAIISILMVSAIGINRLTSRSAILTQYRSSQFLAREMAMSGIHLAIMVLADDAGKNDTDSVQEGWADTEKLSQMTEQLGFEQGSISLIITDELGKLQVNALLKSFPGHEINPDQMRLWENYLALKKAKTESNNQSEKQIDPVAVINAAKDWLDSGDDHTITGISGAESDYYLSLSPPYVCKNGPVDHISELLDIKGFSNALLPSASLGDSVFTVYGIADEKSDSSNLFRYPGQININTASIELIQALLPTGMEEFAQDLVDYRQEKSEDGQVYINPLDKGWVTQVIELTEKEKKWMDRMIRYNSHFFRATCRATAEDAVVTLSAVLKRERRRDTNQWVCRIIQLEEG